MPAGQLGFTTVCTFSDTSCSRIWSGKGAQHHHCGHITLAGCMHYILQQAFILEGSCCLGVPSRLEAPAARDDDTSCFHYSCC